MAQNADPLGWHRVCLNMIVRKGIRLDSERLRILPMGSRVHIVERKERRVRIDQPILGWCSCKSSSGDTILSPLDKARDPAQDDLEMTTPTAANTQRITQEKDRWERTYNKLNKKEQDAQKRIQQIQEDNPELDELMSKLATLKSQLQTQKEILSERDNAKGKIHSIGKEEQNLKSQIEKDNLKLEKLKEKIQNLETKAKTEKVGGENLINLQDRLGRITNEKEKALQRITQADALAKAAKEEMENMRRQMQQMFGGKKTEEEEYEYYPGDVVMIAGGVGIVVVRYCGIVEGVLDGTDMSSLGPVVGVEMSDPNGNTSGRVGENQYFQVGENFGAFYPFDMVKKRITPEQLLHQLHSVIKNLTRSKVAKE